MTTSLAGISRTQKVLSDGIQECISPKQLLGTKVDARTDLYSLGIVLYELVTGNVPYYGQDEMSVMIQHNGAPLPGKILQKYNVPKQLKEILYKSTAKSPNY